MKYLVKVLSLSLLLFVLGLFKVNLASAVECSALIYSGGDTLTSETCSYSATIVGVDEGSGDTNTAVMTIGAGTTLTVPFDQTFVTGSFAITNTGSITIIDGATLLLGAPLYITDSDGDGYPSNTTLYTSSAAGRVRKSTLVSLTADCDDNSNSGTNTCCSSHQHCSDCNCQTCCESQRQTNDCGCNDNTYSCVGYCWDGATCGASGTCTWCDVSWSCNCDSCCTTHCH